LYPVCFDPQATVSGWRQTLKTFASWDKDTVFVAGHGPICGQEGIAVFRALFDDIEDQAQKMHKAGVPAQRLLIFTLFRKNSRTSAFLSGTFPLPRDYEVVCGMGSEVGFRRQPGKHALPRHETLVRNQALEIVDGVTLGARGSRFRIAFARIACIPADRAASTSFVASEMNRNCCGACESEAAIFL